MKGKIKNIFQLKNACYIFHIHTIISLIQYRFGITIAFNHDLNPKGSYKTLRTQMGSFHGPHRPFPNMPSQTFITLVESQFELLSNCLVHSPGGSNGPASKIKSMALYLPQENQFTGQLEFIPGIIYPSPKNERIFIANDAETGLPPTIPRTLTKLPGFAHAQTLLPAYPFASRTSGGGGDGVSASVGEVEEVMCDPSGCSSGSVLSVPLFHGSRTVAVLLTWPTASPKSNTDFDYDNDDTFSTSYSAPWTQADADQIKRAAYSLGVALQMDGERTASRTQADHLRLALAENLHQVRNPLQALRTFGKLLQRKIALHEQLYYQDESGGNNNHVPSYMQINNSNNGGKDNLSNSAMILSIAENMMVQSDRVEELLKPMDSLLLLSPSAESKSRKQQQQLPQSNQITSFGREKISPSSSMLTEFHRNSTTTDRKKSIPQPSLLTEFHRNSTTTDRDTYEKYDNQASLIIYSRSGNNNTSPMRFENYSTFTRKPRPRKKRTPPVSMIPEMSLESQIQPNIGDLSIEIAFFPDVIYPILSAGEAIAVDKNIPFEIQISDDLPGVSVCPKSLQEATSNIIDNALKYVVLNKISNNNNEGSHNPDPKVQVIITPNPSSCKSGVSIIISDNGPGITKGQRERIFERGCRGDDNVSSQVDGTGIGLDVSLELISRMGGLLEVIDRHDIEEEGLRSKILDGAVFRIMLFRDPDLN